MIRVIIPIIYPSNITSQVFLSSSNNLHAVVWFEVFLFDTNNLYTIIWFQVIISIQ